MSRRAIELGAIAVVVPIILNWALGLALWVIALPLLSFSPRTSAEVLEALGSPAGQRGIVLVAVSLVLVVVLAAVLVSLSGRDGRWRHDSACSIVRVSRFAALGSAGAFLLASMPATLISIPTERLAPDFATASTLLSELAQPWLVANGAVLGAGVLLSALAAILGSRESQ